jgi:hypothetical protein
LYFERVSAGHEVICVVQTEDIGKVACFVVNVVHTNVRRINSNSGSKALSADYMLGSNRRIFRVSGFDDIRNVSIVVIKRF